MRVIENLMPIQIPERGSERISADRFAKLRETQEFWNLVDRNLITVRTLASGETQLNAGSFVGRAVCGDELIEIVEKVPGSLEALISYLSNDAIRIERLSGARTNIGRLMSHLVAGFLQLARAYLTKGMEFEYGHENSRGPLVLGAIRIPATVRLRARGFQHHVAFDRTVVSHETTKNVAIGRTLREIESIARLIDLDAASVAQARALRMYFDDYPVAAALSRETIASECEELLQSDSADADLLALCALLLRHESFEPSRWTGASTPRSWFINLESLFEQALRQAIDKVDYAGLSAAKSGAPDRSIFKPPIHETATPDIVLLQEGQTVGIGDAKYKVPEHKPARSDIYQLIVHAAAFNSSVCFLAYPSDHFGSQFFGETVTGAEVHTYKLDVGDLEGSVLSMLEDLDCWRPQSVLDNAA